MNNLSNISRVFGINQLNDTVQSFSKPGLTDYQKCVLLFKVQHLLESNSTPGRSAHDKEMVSLVEFTGKAKAHKKQSKPIFYVLVSGLYLNGIKPEKIQKPYMEYRALKKRQERKFSKTAKAIQELLEKDPYKNDYSQAEIILQNTIRIVSQSLHIKLRKKLFIGTNNIFSRCKFLWRYASPELKEQLREGKISPKQAYSKLKASIEFPTTVKEFKRLIEEKRNSRSKPQHPVRCLFRWGRIEINWKQKRRKNEYVTN